MLDVQAVQAEPKFFTASILNETQLGLLLCYLSFMLFAIFKQPEYKYVNKSLIRFRQVHIVALLISIRA